MLLWHDFNASIVPPAKPTEITYVSGILVLRPITLEQFLPQGYEIGVNNPQLFLYLNVLNIKHFRLAVNLFEKIKNLKFNQLQTCDLEAARWNRADQTSLGVANLYNSVSFRPHNFTRFSFLSSDMLVGKSKVVI